MCGTHTLRPLSLSPGRVTGHLFYRIFLLLLSLYGFHIKTSNDTVSSSSSSSSSVATTHKNALTFNMTGETLSCVSSVECKFARLLPFHFTIQMRNIIYEYRAILVAVCDLIKMLVGSARGWSIDNTLIHTTQRLTPITCSLFDT